jgi:hypothetical protein
MAHLIAHVCTLSFSHHISCLSSFIYTHTLSFRLYGSLTRVFLPLYRGPSVTPQHPCSQLTARSYFSTYLTHPLTSWYRLSVHPAKLSLRLFMTLWIPLLQRLSTPSCLLIVAFHLTVTYTPCFANVLNYVHALTPLPFSSYTTFDGQGRAFIFPTGMKWND